VNTTISVESNHDTFNESQGAQITAVPLTKSQVTESIQGTQ